MRQLTIGASSMSLETTVIVTLGLIGFGLFTSWIASRSSRDSTIQFFLGKILSSLVPFAILGLWIVFFIRTWM